MEENTKKVEYLFEVGDIVKTTKGSVLVSETNSSKWYTEHLRVVFRFWNGAQHAYVLDTGDDGICVISDERGVELEEKRVPAVHENPENVDGRDKNLYLVRNGLGNFHVIAHSFDEAADVLNGRLNQADYGYTSKRQVKSIDFVATQHFFSDKQFFSGDEGHLIVAGDKPW